jgi:uncharacterized protein (TIGR03437 family)
MDEIRVSTKGVVFAPAFVTASFNNQSNPGTFFAAVTGLTNLNRGYSSASSYISVPNPAVNTKGTFAGTSVTPTSMSQPFWTAISSLQCSPKAITAGSAVTCELLTSASPQSVQIELKSSSEQVLTPSVIATRPNQSSLTFQAQSSPATKQQRVTITATVGIDEIQDTVLVTGASSPVLRTPARQVARAGAPMSFMVSAVDTSDLPLQVGVIGLPAGASFTPLTGVFDWSPQASQRGKYLILFTATNSARQSSTAEVEIEVDSGLPTLNTPAMPCSPGAMNTLHGTWLATPGSQLSDPTGATFDIGGTSVVVNGQAAPVLFSSADRVDFLCPSAGTGMGTQLLVEVTSRFGSSQSLAIGIVEDVPTILSMDDSQQNQGLILFYGTTDLVMERNFRVPSHPAQPGDQIVILATGLGLAADTSSGEMQIRLGDTYVGVDSVQAVPGHAGVYAILVRVPAAMTFGAVPVQVQMMTPYGQAISNSVTAAFEAVRQ